MNKHTFELDSEDSLIVLPCMVNDEQIALALDTGASHTVVDLTKLMMCGYRIADTIENVKFETAKGEVDAYVFEVDIFVALGISLKNIKVASYDFLANNLMSDIDGVLGLDFFRDIELYINFKTCEIVLSS